MKPHLARFLFNLYPPYLGTGIRIMNISDDYRHVEVAMALRWYNRNAVGTHFGGSLSAMTDPFYMLMVMHNLGPDYVVWDRAGTIDYIRPGRGRVTATFDIDRQLLDEMRTKTAGGKKMLKTLEVDILDEHRKTVAHVTRTLYIRRKEKPGEN